VGEKSEQRALNVYSAVAAPFAAPKYSAAVEDALSITWDVCSTGGFFIGRSRDAQAAAGWIHARPASVRAHLPPTRRRAGALSARYGVVGQPNLATLSSSPFSVNSKIFSENEKCSDLQKLKFKIVQIRKLFKSKKLRKIEILFIL
jgi:hypothetical protein